MLLTVILLGFVIGNIFGVLNYKSSRGVLGPTILGVVGAFVGLTIANLFFNSIENSFFTTTSLWVSSLIGALFLPLLSEILRPKSN